MPRASIAEDMVLAVKRPAHDPSPGQATRSSSSKLSVRHGAARVCAHGLEHVLDVDVAPLEAARHDGASVYEHGGYVQARHGHETAGHVLVASRDGHQPVEPLGHRYQLDGVGDDLAADQRGLHALRAHGDAVAHGDGAKLERGAAGVAYALLDASGQPTEVDVAGRDVAGEIGDSNEGVV